MMEPVTMRPGNMFFGLVNRPIFVYNNNLSDDCTGHTTYMKGIWLVVANTKTEAEINILGVLTPDGSFGYVFCTKAFCNNVAILDDYE